MRPASSRISDFGFRISDCVDSRRRPANPQSAIRNPQLFSTFVLIVLLGIAAFAPSSVTADDWPIWLGLKQDATFDEKGWLKDWPETGPPRLFQIPAGEGYTSVVVAEGNLILFHRIGRQMHVDNLDALTGKRRWRFSYATRYSDPYSYSGGPRCCPMIDLSARPRRVFTLGPDGELHALDLATGKKQWRRDLLTEFNLDNFFFGVGAAPAIHGDRLFVNLGGTDFAGSGRTIALDKKDGRTVWSQVTAGGAYAAARVERVAGADQLFIFHRGGMTCFDPRDGKRKWEFPWHSRIYESVNATTPLIVGDILFFTATYGTGAVALRVKESSYEPLWRDTVPSRGKILDSHWSTVIHVDGYLYGFAGRHEPEGSLRCVELKTGKVLWRWRSYLGRGTFIYSDGHFIAQGERGDLALLRLSPEGYKELRRVRRLLKWPAWAVPTFAGGLLYLRDEEKLLCMDLRVGAANKTK